jgi:penicillin-binding protein 2
MVKSRGAPPFVPIVIKPDLTREELARVETYKFENPGLSISSEPRRYYIYPTMAAHLIGYTGQVNERQLATGKLEGVRMGDRVGQYGAEQAWQKYLAGTRGGRQVEVDATGRVLQVLQEIPAKPGKNLILTIDARLQKIAEEALTAKAGAAVALDPNNGQVLAMASKPAFDQTRFVRGISAGEWADLIRDPLHPLENRALTGQYPPGSTYKIVTAIAGLAEGVITPESTFWCPGHYYFGGRPYGCWKKSGHGHTDVHKALVQSCDVFFYKTGQKLGVDRLAKYARALGLGRATGVGLWPEKPGLIPTAAWKKRRFGVPWQEGETLSISIGQGFDLATPLQMANLMATVANGGTLFQPQVVLGVEEAGGKEVALFQPKIKSKLDVKPWILNLVRKALMGVVHEKRGTGSRAKVEGINVGGKTGTAQVVRLEKFKGVKDIEDIPYKYRDHAWFVAFAPVENPQIAVAVVAEHSGHGGSQAAPVAQKILEGFFSLKEQDMGLEFAWVSIPDGQEG